MPDDHSRQITILEQHFKPLLPQFQEVLHGSSIEPDRLIRSIIWAVETNPTLMECSKESILRFGMTTASLRLEPNPQLGQIFAIPFGRGSQGGRRTGAKDAQTIMGYRGYQTIGWRDGITINGNVVREGDQFDFLEGSAGFVNHKRKIGHWASRPIIAAWATATSQGRAPIVVVMDIDEIEDIKARAPGGNSERSPWNDPKIGYVGMAIKTPKRRLARSMPFGAFTMAATMEEAFEERGKQAWIEPKRGVVVEGEAVTLPGPQPQPSAAETAAVGTAPSFPIHKNNGTYRAASIDEWRGRMEIAVNAIRSVENLERFRDLNGAVLSDLHPDFPQEVDAVAALIDKRLKEL
jgi:phage RecT family recombinase